MEMRLDRVMVLVDRWAEESALLDMRAEALSEVEWLLAESPELSDREMADVAVGAWMMAE